MKNALARVAAPVLYHHRAPHNPVNVGLVELAASNEKHSTVRVFISIMKNEIVGGYDLYTVTQYKLGQPWVTGQTEWTSDIRLALKKSYELSRKAFKTAVSREFAATVAPAVYVPDTDDIDC